MRNLLYATVILGLIVVALVVYNMHGTVRLESGADYDAIAEHSFWVDRIKQQGARSAYKEFVKTNRDASVTVQHARAHIIGEALFDTLGTGGIAVCDSQFGFGCFHGLFVIGFASEGSAFIKRANNMCLERYGPLGTGCQHGIGHGIIEYIGRDNLHKALELCKETSQPTPLLGCTSGVFMEHNTPFTILPGQPVPEPYPFTDEKSYGRCNEVPKIYQESCYYELGGWWEAVLQSDKLRMGALCADIHDEELRDACALGVGNIIGPTNNYSVSASKQLCARMPASIVTLCHAGVAWSMFSNPEFTERADEMCAELEPEQKERCRASYDLTADYVRRNL